MCMISLFFVNTDHADVLSYEEMNKIYLKGAVSDHFIQFPTKLANSWLRAYILNAPEVCNISRGQTLETKVSLESSNLKILWSSREPHSPVRHLKQKKRNAFFARLCPISYSFQFFTLVPGLSFDRSCVLALRKTTGLFEVKPRYWIVLLIFNSLLTFVRDIGA